MIDYHGQIFGFSILVRMHGSAAARAVMPSILSVCIYFIILKYYDMTIEDGTEDKWDFVDHPYVIGAVMACFTFLLVFRANFSYNRVSS